MSIKRRSAARRAFSGSRWLLGVAAAALGTLAGAAAAQTARETVANLGLPELVSARGSGTISIDFAGCTAPALNGTRTGQINVATVDINTRTFVGTATLQTTLGIISATVTVDQNDDTSGTWRSAALDNAGTPVAAQGTLNGNVDLDSGDVSDDFSTVTFTDLSFDTGSGSSSPCSSVLVRISGSLIIDTSGAASVELTQSQALSNFVNSLATIIPARTAGRLRHGSTASVGIRELAGGLMLEGSSAGDGFGYPWGAWASYQRTDFEHDLTISAFDADSNIVFVGADFMPWDNLVFGVALGYEDTDTDTFFNAGAQELTGVSVVPYLGARLSDQLGVDFDVGFDFAIGYTDVGVDQFRTLAGARISSEADATRWFVQSNVNAGNTFGNWYLNAQAGLLYASEEQDEFTEFNSDGTVHRRVGERNVELGRALAGADVAYTWNNFEPFAGALYQIDFTQFDFRQAIDRDEVFVNAGFRWFHENVSATFRWSSVLARENFDSTSYTFTIRADF